jgi:glycine cleavage system H protein
MDTVRFRHAHFSARFPVDCRYAPSHFWMRPAAEEAGGEAGGGRLWRVGFTKFATRMLGELVELRLECPAGATVEGGDRLGTVEGFKAVSDLFCVVDGTLAGANPGLTAEACLTHSDPYGAGWLYAVRGEPAAGHLDVQEYVALLTTTINRLEASRRAGHDGEAAAPFGTDSTLPGDEG